MSESDTITGTIAWRLTQIEKRQETVEGKVNWLIFAVAAASLTFATGVVVACLTFVLAGP